MNPNTINDSWYLQIFNISAHMVHDLQQQLKTKVILEIKYGSWKFSHCGSYSSYESWNVF